jgi:hypothetical protein
LRSRRTRSWRCSAWTTERRLIHRVPAVGEKEASKITVCKQSVGHACEIVGDCSRGLEAASRVDHRRHVAGDCVQQAHGRAHARPSGRTKNGQRATGRADDLCPVGHLLHQELPVILGGVGRASMRIRVTRSAGVREPRPVPTRTPRRPARRCPRPCRGESRRRG